MTTAMEEMEVAKVVLAMTEAMAVMEMLGGEDGYGGMHHRVHVLLTRMCSQPCTVPVCWPAGFTRSWAAELWARAMGQSTCNAQW